MINFILVKDVILKWMKVQIALNLIKFLHILKLIHQLIIKEIYKLKLKKLNNFILIELKHNKNYKNNKKTV